MKERNDGSRNKWRNVSIGTFILGASLIAVGASRYEDRCGLDIDCMRGKKPPAIHPQSTIQYVPPTPAAELVTVIPTPEKLKDLRINIQATELRIPTAQLADGIPIGPSKKEGGTFSLPTSGAVTPEDNIKDFENKSLIFGHSRWHGVRQALGHLDDVNIGDDIFIKGIDRDTKQDLGELDYKVDQIIVADNDAGIDLIFKDPTPEIPKIFIQTSLRQDVQGADNLLNIPLLEKKATFSLGAGHDLNSYDIYLYLIVVGSLSKTDQQNLQSLNK